MNDEFYSFQFLCQQWAFQHQCDVNVLVFEKYMELISNEENT